jgi:hypothetical protein
MKVKLKQGLQAVESSPRFYVWLSVLAAFILLAGYATPGSSLPDRAFASLTLWVVSSACTVTR